MIAMHIGDLQGARAAIAQGGHAYSSSYTHCEVRVHLAVRDLQSANLQVLWHSQLHVTSSCRMNTLQLPCH